MSPKPKVSVSARLETEQVEAIDAARKPGEKRSAVLWRIVRDWMRRQRRRAA